MQPLITGPLNKRLQSLIFLCARVLSEPLFEPLPLTLLLFPRSRVWWCRVNANHAARLVLFHAMLRLLGRCSIQILSNYACVRRPSQEVRREYMLCRCLLTFMPVPVPVTVTVPVTGRTLVRVTGWAAVGRRVTGWRAARHRAGRYLAISWHIQKHSDRRIHNAVL